MIQAEQCFINCLTSPVRNVQGRVELYEGSTLLSTWKKTDRLVRFSVERTGEPSKFFGFGVGQKLTVELLDPNRELELWEGMTLEAVFGTGCDYVYTNPLFYFESMTRDEATGSITITAYDALHKAANLTLNDLKIVPPYTLETLAKSVGTALGLPVRFIDIREEINPFGVVYAQGANFEGTETLREVLTAIAEATMTVYYINYDWELVFKNWAIDGQEYLITKDNYYNLTIGDVYTLSGVGHQTELGDNLISDDESGVVQWVRNNPLWELRDDLPEILDTLVEFSSGQELIVFDLDWRGNYLIEIGDYVAVETKDGPVYIKIYDDKIEYDGGLSQKTRWSYEPQEAQSSNPTTLGEKVKETYAKVDKANKRIDLVVSEVGDANTAISQLSMDTQTIQASVNKNQEELTQLKLNSDSIMASVLEDIEGLKKSVEATMTEDQIQLLIKEEVGDGAAKVETSTGFTFDEEGLNITKSGSEMSTTITEDGMTVYKNNTAVLTANNVGVDAVNLHATTYLIIGNTSRFEDYENGTRTGCFWMGG